MKEFNAKELGERLQSLRKEERLGQNQLAALLHIRNTSVRY